MAAAVQDLSALGSTPVEGESAAGASARDEPEFETIQNEIEKMHSVHQEPVDWDAVVENSSQILAEKSKDLTVACYLCLGLLERDGYAGLVTGLTVVRDLMTTYWDTMYPPVKRARARAAAVSWLGEKAGAAVAERKPGGGEREVVTEAFERLGEIDGILEEKLKGHDYSLMDVYRPLRDAVRDFERQDKKADSEKSGAAGGSGAGAGGADLGSVQVTSKSEAQKVTRACQSAIRTLAGYLRGEKLSDPAPYRMLRFAIWMNVDRIPPSNDGETQLPALPEEKRTACENLLDSGDYEGLIKDVEETVGRSPFWLDAHRYCATALQELGSEYAAARAAVIGSVAEFVQRVPGIEELNFQGGVPFADDATRAWLRSEVAAAAQGGGEAPAAPPQAEAELAPWEQAEREAKKLRGKRKFKDGLLLFQQGRDRAPSERERFLWDMTMANFCLEAGYADMALPQLEYLDDLVERFALESWEPALSVEVARLMLMCHAKSRSAQPNKAAGPNDRIERARARIFRLDAAAALELRNKAK